MKYAKTAAAAMALLLTVQLAGCQSSSVHIDSEKYEKNAEVVQITQDPMASLEALGQFTALRQLDVRGSGISKEDYQTLSQLLPQCEILWDIPFQGKFLDGSTQSITLEKLSDEDLAMLDYFPRLNQIDAENCSDFAALQKLMELHPDWEIRYRVPLGSETYSCDETSLSSLHASAEEIAAAIALLPKLETVDLRGSGVSSKDACALAEAFPDVAFVFEFQVGDKTFCTDAEEIDVSNMEVNVPELEAVVPYCKNLKKVVMCDCGISNEDMDALNKRHEDVQFVWHMMVGLVSVRTDDKFFAPITQDFTKVWGDEEFAKLNYMTEVECVDLGHNEVHDITWVKNMPKLKYLIIADTPVKDIEPLAGHPSLVYLEIFSTTINDYTPLTTCYALEDINISRTRGDPEPLAQMTWLKNIWWGDNLSEVNLLPEYQANRAKAEEILPKALPDTNVMLFYGAPTLKGWRDLPNYFKMRDCMGMFYMQGSTD